jgi:glycolate oxidase FAD binding subunit
VPQALVGGVAAPPPSDLRSLAAALKAGAGRRARLHVRGAGLWWPDAPADAEVVSVAALDAVSDFNPADLVVTSGAGTPLDALTSRLAARGAFLALDPPGPPSRSLGGVLATGSSGPLAAHYGSVRDQVLGLVVVAGDGTVVRLGGRVVKNVAGFDLAKLVIGGYGGFGVIAEAHLRLRALPKADRTAAWAGDAGWASRAAGAALAAGATPAALEVVSPELAAALDWGDGWVLAARALGAPAGIDEELDLVARAAGGRPAPAVAADGAWARWRAVVGRWPMVVRIGADPAAWADGVALARRHLGPLLGASITVPRGTVRIGADGVAPEGVRRLRADAAARHWPVTLERADAATRAAVGVWGALPPAAERLTRELRALFDPAGSLAAPLLA